MKFLHSMIRVRDKDASLHFYTELLGLKLLYHIDFEEGRFSLYFLATEEGAPLIELTHNWNDREYSNGDNFGHLAFEVEDIYALCEKLDKNGVSILRPPRDGKMAFIKDPNFISIELLQKGNPLPPREPWLSMPNKGTW